jgi:hypothetical protein
MFEFRNRRLFAPAFAVALAGIVLGGCEASKDGDPMPPPPPDSFKADFNPSLSVAKIPYPFDLYFLDPADPTFAKWDGTLSIIPGQAQNFPRLTAMQNALNSMDGFGTNSDITTSFNAPIRADSIGAANTRVIEMCLNNVSKAPTNCAGAASPVRRILVYGKDYTTSVSDDIDSEDRFLKITPLKPLTPSTGSTNIGYMVVLTNGILDVDGRQAQPDDYYAGVKARANCDGLTGVDSYLCQVIKGQLQIAAALPAPVGVPAANVVLTWSFTTQSVDDTLNVITASVPGTKPTVINIGKTTKDLLPALPDAKANVYTGSLQVPYYLTAAANNKDTAPLTKFWTAAGPSPVPGVDPTSRNVTRFNPLPAVTSVQAIPLLVTVPNAAAAGGACGSGATPPTGGWPVVIVQHGLGRNRTDVLSMANSYADACMVVAAIDAPLHGLTPETGGPLYCSWTTPNPICAGAKERTFDLDVAAPFGTIDPSGSNFAYNLLNPATVRDTLRQAEADLVMLEKSVTLMDLNGDGTADVNPNRIHFAGLSLGGIVGGGHVHFNPNLQTVTLSAPGGPIMQIYRGPAFYPSVKAGLSASLVPDSYAWNLFFRDFQAVIDSGDPINHLNDAVKLHPTYLQKVTDDTVIPNSTTVALIDSVVAPNTFKRVSSGTTPVSDGNAVWVEFPYGHHGSLFTPQPCSSFPASVQALCVATTTEMQTEAVTFAASVAATGGPFLTVKNPTVVKQ